MHLLEHINDEPQIRLSLQLNYTFVNSIVTICIEMPCLDNEYNRFHQFLNKKKEEIIKNVLHLLPF